MVTSYDQRNKKYRALNQRVSNVERTKTLLSKVKSSQDILGQTYKKHTTIEWNQRCFLVFLIFAPCVS